jgi:hypothetical protein
VRESFGQMYAAVASPASRGQTRRDQDVASLGGMVRRVVGVAAGLVVIGALGLALGDRDEKVPSYPSTEALGGDISAHGIGCARVYPIRGPLFADHDAVNCEVGSAMVTLHVWGVSPPPIDLGEASRHTPWVVGPNWLVATTNRLAAIQVAMVIGGDLIPSWLPDAPLPRRLTTGWMYVPVA